MSKRNRREHGRILSVETMQRGSALDIDTASGATSITVTDAGDFDEDGGWLYIGAQVVEYTECDDDTGVITLVDPLAAAAEQGDPVAVYDPLYAEVVDYQVALVQLDGEYDNPDPVEAEVAEGVEDLPEGDRGKAGESCTLHRVADDEWEIVGVGGRSRKSRGLRAEWDDSYVLTAADITAGTATVPLTHRPANEWLIAVLAGIPQRPSNFTVNYDAQTITWPLSGWERAGDRIWVHYAYRKGVTTATLSEADTVPSMAWYRLGEASGTTLVDSGSGAHNGTYGGGVTLGTPGLFGATNTAATFDGVNDYAQVAYTNPDGYGAGGWMDKGASLSAFTVSAKIKPSAVNGKRTIVGRGVIWTLAIVDGHLQLDAWWSGSSPSIPVTGSTTLVAGTEYRVAARQWNNGKIQVYVNGTLDGEATFNLEIREYTDPLLIGAELVVNNPTPTNNFAGVIDEVKWFDYLIDPSQMGAL